MPKHIKDTINVVLYRIIHNLTMSEKCYNQHKLQVTKNSNREMLNECVDYNLSMLTKNRIKPEIVDLLLFPVNVANKGTIQRL